ncbi:iron ABC transporter permease [Candidatus Desantisbacteria bacterium]|nr:iron ABC transporter permease [Candidatus Desantisbacteria bacterium]
MNKKIIKWITLIMILFIILLCTGIFSLCVGASGIPLRKIISFFFDKNTGVELSIIFDIRLPRIILGFAIGGALSIAGVILQGMFVNPLVEPYTLGISGGAALGVCLGISFKLTNKFGILSMPVLGILGAGMVIILIYFLNIKRGLFKIYEVLLTGVMISFVSSSFVMLIMAVSGAEDLRGIIFWMMGSLEEPNWLLIKISVLISVIGLLASYSLSISLNALSLGEDNAQHLGINTETTKRLLFLISSILTGLSVSICGMIGFIGLVVPHFSRMLVGNDNRILLICSYLCGAIFLILCDTLARTIIAPLELPVGVITGIFGGSLFVYAITKKRTL